jgi:hypothetical protein
VSGGSLVLQSGHGTSGAPQMHCRDVAPLSDGRSGCASRTHPVLSLRSHERTVVMAILPEQNYQDALTWVKGIGSRTQ